MVRLNVGIGAVVLALLAGGCAKDDEAKKREHLRAGEQYLADGNLQAATVAFRNAIDLDGRFGDARYRLAQAYARLGDWPRARTEFVRAADLMPQDADVQVAAGQALLRFNQFQDARSRAELALKIDPKHANAHLLRGNASAGLRDFDGAVKAYEAGLAVNADQPELHLNVGGVQALQGNLAVAEASFKQAVSVSPKSLLPRVALANFYWSTARLRQAEETLREALAIDAKDVEANRALAALLMATSRAKEAEGPLKAAAEAADASQQKLVLADYYVAQNRHADALPVLEALATRPEVFAAATARRAGIEFELGRKEQAYGIVEQILAKDPKNIAVLTLKGKWLLGEGKKEEAFKVAQAAMAADNQSAAAYELLGLVQASRRYPDEAVKALTEALRLNPNALEPQIALAELNFSQGRLDAARRFAEEAVRSRATSAVARMALVKVLIAQGELVRAQTESQPLAALTSVASAQALLGEIEMRRGRIAEARQAFERAVAIDPASQEALAGLVRLDLGAKMIPQARQRVEQFTKRTSNSPRGFLIAAETYALAGDLKEAEAAARKAIELDADYFEAYSLLGQLYVRQQRLDAARDEYTRIVERRPNNIAAHTMIGMLLQVQQKDAEAKVVYERILNLDSRAVVAANNLAYMYALQGTNLDVALNLAQTAKAGRPDDPDVNDTLGWIYYKRNLPAMAVEPLEQSVRSDPKNPVYQYHLGMSYLRLGEKQKARAALEQALKLQPDFEGASETKQALASLKGNGL
jgi:tetratricopeptide (TPR) repeat protein